MDILAHVPNLQHLGIPEYVKKSSETVDVFLTTAVFLSFCIFSSANCAILKLCKNMPLLQHLDSAPQKEESIFSTMNEIEGIALPCL